MFRAAVPALAMLIASFPGWTAMDCSRAQSNAEKMLCSNTRLMQADERLAFAYRAAIRRGVNPQELIDSQRAWIKDARDACNDVDCMLRAYQDRIVDLEGR